MGITEYINLEHSGNNNGYDQKGIICMLPILQQLQPLILQDYSIYNIEGKFKVNKKTLCVCKFSKYCSSRADLAIKLELS
jgi:hypothetical protein